jgi:hypothetical protein
MGIFEKLFRRKKKEQKKPDFNPDIKTEKVINLRTSSKPEPEIITILRETYKDQSLSELNDLYFNTMDKLLAAKKIGDIGELLMLCQSSLGLLEPLIKYNYREYGDFAIRSIPAIENGLIYFAINGNNKQLKNISEFVNYFKDLHSFKYEVDIAFKRRKLATNIYKYVKSNPKCFQPDLKKNIACDDGRFISTTVRYMEKSGKLRKEKQGKKLLLTVI